MFKFIRKKYKDNENFDTKIKDIKILIDEGNYDIAIKEIEKVEEIEKDIFMKQIKLNSSIDLVNIYNKKIFSLKELKKDTIIQKKLHSHSIFHLFKKKELDSDNIKRFKEAIKAIEIYIQLSEWDKAKRGIEEIEKKEKETLETILNSIRADKSPETEKIKLKLIKENKEKIKKIKILKEKENKKENIYIKNDEKRRFNTRFKIIKEEIKTLTGNKKNDEAISLLHNFLEEYKDKTIVIKFFNREKKFILQNIEKQNKINNKKIKDNARIEAMKLIGQTIKLSDEDKKEEKEKKDNFFQKLKKKFNFYKNLKEQRYKKKLFDEISLLIDESSKVKQDIATKKLENIHRGLIKELVNENMIGYELYGKILGADKISGDTFGIYDDDEKYVFFLGDATGHGIRAGFIITLLSRLFNKYIKSKKISELVFEINNGLKQDLKSRNFITGIFFEIIKKQIGAINFVGMGHEPMLIYRKKEGKVEKIIAGGLAAGIRIMNDESNVKVSHLELEDGDILLTYSDGIVENKNEDGEFYGISKLIKTFNTIASYSSDINEIYEYIINNIKTFKLNSQFVDDASILILKRNSNKDIQDNKSKYLKDLTIKEGLEKKELKRLIGKDKIEIEKELSLIKKEKETKRIIKNLENLYYTGEVLKLKQEAKRYITEGFIHKKINKYLKFAIKKENQYRIEQKNKKMLNKYSVLKELEKKGDYSTVINEIENIITKDGNI